MKIIIASDHAGVELKTSIINYFSDIEFFDCGIAENQNADYPDVAKKLCRTFIQEKYDFGILICGSGVGVSVVANRFANIRAVLCFDEQISKLSREHNDANIICLGARFIAEKKAFSIIKTFLNSEFSGGRHKVRIKKID